MTVSNVGVVLWNNLEPVFTEKCDIVRNLLHHLLDKY